MVSHSCLDIKPLQAAGRNPKCDCKHWTAAAARLTVYCFVLSFSFKNWSATVELCGHLPSLAPAVDDCPVHLILKFLFFCPEEECFTVLPLSFSSYSPVGHLGEILSSPPQSESQEGRMQCPARSEPLSSSVLSWWIIPARIIRWFLEGISWYYFFMRIHCKHTVFISEHYHQ